jgi:hypothetical protein
MGKKEFNFIGLSFVNLIAMAIFFVVAYFFIGFLSPLVTAQGWEIFGNVWVHHSSIGFYGFIGCMILRWHYSGNEDAQNKITWIGLFCILLIVNGVFMFGNGFSQIVLLQP